ncbi:g3592 [Coccomyxa elongata]
MQACRWTPQACVRSKEDAKVLELINLLQLTHAAVKPGVVPGMKPGEQSRLHSLHSLKQEHGFHQRPRRCNTSQRSGRCTLSYVPFKSIKQAAFLECGGEDLGEKRQKRVRRLRRSVQRRRPRVAQ